MSCRPLLLSSLLAILLLLENGCVIGHTQKDVPVRGKAQARTIEETQHLLSIGWTELAEIDWDAVARQLSSERDFPIHLTAPPIAAVILNDGRHDYYLALTQIDGQAFAYVVGPVFTEKYFPNPNANRRPQPYVFVGLFDKAAKPQFVAARFRDQSRRELELRIADGPDEIELAMRAPMGLLNVERARKE